MKDVAVIGGGISGMATAARLQAQGLSTVVFEAHGTPGGCAGYYRRRGFSFDVGATTLVDFEEGGVGGEFLREIGMSPLAADPLPGYLAWLPDRVAVLSRNANDWSEERLRVFGDTPDHRQFWSTLDALSSVLWIASRRGVKLPIRSWPDAANAIHALGLRNLPMARYLGWTMGDFLRACNLRNDDALVGLLGMLIEDTVHSTVDDAPLANAAMGVTIRDVGLCRAQGGMRGFWNALVEHYRSLGGELRVGHTIRNISVCQDGYRVTGARGVLDARQVVSALPISLTSTFAPAQVGKRLAKYIRRDEPYMGGAVVVFVGVSEADVATMASSAGAEAIRYTHHQVLQDYSGRLGNGNNMFISMSAPGDIESAPPGHRAVMISTHCDIQEWKALNADDYERHKHAAGDRLVNLARRVYPDLGRNPLVYEIGTPKTYERFTHRPNGAVGGVRLSLSNANQNAVPHDVGLPGFHIVGDTTWPGLGTVACVLGSKIVANQVLLEARRLFPRKEENSYVFANDRSHHATAHRAE